MSENKEMAIHDISRAFFYAEAIRPVFVKIPNEAREAGDDQRGVCFKKRLGRQPHLTQAPGAKGLDHNIGTLRKRHEFETPGIFAQVQLACGFATIQESVRHTPSPIHWLNKLGGVARTNLNLNNKGTEPNELASGKWTWKVSGKVENTKTVERRFWRGIAWGDWASPRCRAISQEGHQA